MWLYLILGVIALLVYLAKSCKFDYWDKKGVPTASGCEWFFGHFRPIMFLTKHINDVYTDMYKEFPDAPLVGYYAMNAPGLIVKDLDLIKFILVSEFSSFNNNGQLVDKKIDPLAGSHPFFLAGEDWKTARGHVAPALTVAKLKGYLQIMLNVGDDMVKYVEDRLRHTSELEMMELVNKYITDVVAKAIFGVENDSFTSNNAPVSRLVREIGFKLSLKENFKQFLKAMPILQSFFPPRFTPKKLEDMMVNLVTQLVAERTDKETGEQPSDAFQVLLNLKQNDTKGVITNEILSGYVFAIIVDLYHTSSRIASVILYMLSRHPEVQEKLRDEIREIKSRNKGIFTIEDVENAKYLEMVLCESYRLHCFVPSRICTQDCYLPVPNSDPILITKGTPVTIPVACIHKDPKYYPDPETFDPERFTEEEIAKRPKFTFMPFGEGPKKCMGIRISNIQIKVALIKIIEKFRLTPSSKTKYPLQLDITEILLCRPIDGTWVVFEPIE